MKKTKKQFAFFNDEYLRIVNLLRKDEHLRGKCARVLSSVVERNICIVEAEGSIPPASIFGFSH